MNKILFCFSLFFGVFIFFSCENKIGKIVPKTSVGVLVCDSIKYSKHIAPIIAQKCSTPGCHASGFPNGDFTTYAGLNTRIINGKFKARVIDANPGPMPASGKLPESQLDSIRCWLDKGAPNN